MIPYQPFKDPKRDIFILNEPFNIQLFLSHAGVLNYLNPHFSRDALIYAPPEQDWL